MLEICLLLIALGSSATGDDSTSQTQLKADLNRCEGFIDNRDVTGSEVIIEIPGNLTNSNETVHFRISPQEYKLPCSNYFETRIKWEDGHFIQIKKSKHPSERLNSSIKTSSHFTHDGHFHNDAHYYKTSDYCVKSISDYEVQLNLCKITCHQNASVLCVPKCCGVDEYLVYWNFTCRKIRQGETKWIPRVFKNPHKEVTDAKALEKIHIYRKPICSEFEKWPLTKVLRANKAKAQKEGLRNDAKFPWKLLENGQIVFLNHARKWTNLPEGDYCLDGFANWGDGGDNMYSGNSKLHSIMLFCPNKTKEVKDKFESWKAWTFSVLLLFFSLFLLLTAIVHFLLWEKQHLHGLTVLSYSVSMFFMYVFCAIAHIVSLYPSLKAARSPFCLSIAILSHYFFMTNFTWLSIMNFDLWLTFRSMRPVSQMSKRIRRFRLYSTIGWGLPIILSASFYAVDEVYRDPETEVVVPDYAGQSCFVAIWSRGYYMYSLVAIALSFNTILVLWTFHIFYEFRKQNAHTFTTKRTKSDKYSVRLFIKLFCVMGVAWFVELLSWYYNGDKKPWPVVILDCMMFFQAVAIFVIFCINRRTLKQLEEKYACLRKLIRPLQAYKWFNYSEGDGGVEMTTPGSRKQSFSVTTNTKVDSSLPRKASTSSSKSLGSNGSSNNKILANAKVERYDSISLDSECESIAKPPSYQDVVQHAPDLIINT